MTCCCVVFFTLIYALKLVLPSRDSAAVILINDVFTS